MAVRGYQRRVSLSVVKIACHLDREEMVKVACLMAGGSTDLVIYPKKVDHRTPRLRIWLANNSEELDK